jgi:hypothetical protein
MKNSTKASLIAGVSTLLLTITKDIFPSFHIQEILIGCFIGMFYYDITGGSKND